VSSNEPGATFRRRAVWPLATVGEIEATLVDAGNPCVLVAAADVGLRGPELPDEINADLATLARLEAVRAAGAVAMGLARTPEQATRERPAVPKIGVLASPAGYATTAGTEVAATDIDLIVRMLSMGRVHHAVPVTGAMAVAVACALPGSLAARLRRPGEGPVRLGHPAGATAMEAEVEPQGGSWRARRVTLGRTARRLKVLGDELCFRRGGIFRHEDGMKRIAAALLLGAGRLAAQQGPWNGLRLGGKPGPGEWSAPLEILLWLTLLVLLPAAIISLTPFLRLLVVLHFLRQALGTQSAPSNQVLAGLSLFLTLLLMQPTGARIYEQAIGPLDRGEIGMQEALARAAVPVKGFLARYVREKDVALFLEISHAPRPRNLDDLDLQVLMPAYVLSELRTAFQIGAVLFLPFLIIDLLVASITLSLGMLQLPPVMISAPFKILLFVVVDGWNLVVGSLVKSF